MKPTERPVALKPEAAAAPAIGLDGNAALTQQLQITAKRAQAYAEFAGEVRRRDMLARLQEPLKLLQAP